MTERSLQKVWLRSDNIFDLGSGANSFLTYQFNLEFASGLVSVQIDAPRWAMDNLVWIPEPSTYALLGLGLLALTWQRLHKSRKL